MFFFLVIGCDWYNNHSRKSFIMLDLLTFDSSLRILPNLHFILSADTEFSQRFLIYFYGGSFRSKCFKLMCTKPNRFHQDTVIPEGFVVWV